MRGFSAQADRNCFAEAANSVRQEGVKFDSPMLRITEFAVGTQLCQILFFEGFGNFSGVCLRNKTRMTGDKTEHSQSYIFWVGASERFLNHFSIRVSPAGMQDSGVNTEPDAITVILASPGGVNSPIKVSGSQFVFVDCFGTINAPGNDGLYIGFDAKQIVDVCAFGQQHKISVWESGEKIHKNRREVCNMVEGEGIKHFSHIEADFVPRQTGSSELGDLPKHCVIVYVDFYEGMMFAIYEGKIAVDTAVWATIGDGNEFIVRVTADAAAKFPVEVVDERGCLANHQGSFALNNRLTDGVFVRRHEPLVVDDFDRCRWEQVRYASGLGDVGDFSPNQNDIRSKGSCGIQRLFSKTLLL
jgi:hypothetical protein